jgi:hypothetical protein
VDAGNGPDAVAASLYLAGMDDPNMAEAPPVNASFILGDGGDALQFTCASAAAYTDLNLFVDAGRGKDAVQVDFDIQDAGVVMPCDVVGDVAVNLGADDDTFGFNYYSEAEDTDLKLVVDASTGSDFVQVALTGAGALPPEHYFVDVDVDLGTQDDRLEFGIYSEAVDADVKLRVEGDQGKDAVFLALSATGMVEEGNFVADIGVNLGFDDDVFEFTGDSAAYETNLKLAVDGGLGSDVVAVGGVEIPCNLFVDIAVNLSGGSDIFEFGGTWSA